MVWAVSLSTTELSPHSLTPGFGLMAFEVWLDLARYSLAESIQSSTSISEHPRLYLNTFRGEPAITEFVWHITPTHSSSDNFATLNGSGLHSELIGASPWPWVAHPASGLIRATIIALLRLAFATAPQLNCLTSYTD
jgi:hypothetical protein